MAKGTVKWFSNAKGYGFIESDVSEQDIFAHYTAIQAEGYRRLQKGQEVEFVLEEGPKGQLAREIRPLSRADAGTRSD